MSNNCVRFFEEPSTNPGNFTPEFAKHILTCEECQKNLKSIQNLRSHLKPLTATELSEIGSIVAAASSTATASTAAGKTLKTTFTTTKIGIIILVSTVTIGFFGLNHFSFNISQPSGKTQNNGMKPPESSQTQKMTQNSNLVYKPKVTIAQMKHVKKIANEKHLAMQKTNSEENMNLNSIATKVLSLAKKAFAADNAYFSALLNSQTPPAKIEALKLEREKAVEAFETILKKYPEYALNSKGAIVSSPGKTDQDAPEAELSKIGEAEDSFRNLEKR